MTPDRPFRRAFIVIGPATVAAAVMLVQASGVAQESLPLRVHVTTIALPALPVLTPEQHEQEIARTRSQQLAEADRLRQKYGGKTKSWPNEAWDQFNRTEDAHAQAVARADYEPDVTRGLEADSVKDVLKELRKSKVLTLVAGAEQADLVIGISGRRLTSPAVLTDNAYFVRFSLEPGALADRARVLEAMRRHEWNGQTTKVISRPWDAAGFADLEAASPFGMRQAGEWVVGMVERFARERFGPAKK
jgi:hypothetical protein